MKAKTKPKSPVKERKAKESAKRKIERKIFKIPGNYSRIVFNEFRRAGFRKTFLARDFPATEIQRELFDHVERGLAKKEQADKIMKQVREKEIAFESKTVLRRKGMTGNALARKAVQYGLFHYRLAEHYERILKLLKNQRMKSNFLDGKISKSLKTARKRVFREKIFSTYEEFTNTYLGGQ